MRILVTGGAGYVGSRLVPRLLKRGHEVVVYDTFWFGDHLPTDPWLTKWNRDIRDAGSFSVALTTHGHCDAVIHLACISNDPSVELDESLSRTINFEAFEPLVVAAKAAGVKRFIYCSTSSVYGVSDAPEVTEEHPLVPLTLYNTTKAQCEPLLRKHVNDDFVGVIIRPSTVCGYSPRMRLDLAANILTNLAVNKGVITVFGGQQKRPNIHIEDMVDVYELMLNAPAEKVQGETFNVGAANLTIAEIASLVQLIVQEQFGQPVAIETKPLQDQRSYQVSSHKIWRALGYKTKRTVADGVLDVCRAFDWGLLPNPLDDAKYYNVRKMREVWEEVYKGAPPSAFDPTQGVLSEIDLKHRGVGA